MNEEVNKIIDNLNPNIRKLIEDFNLEIVEPESVECVCLKGFEKNDNRMVIWNFDNDTTTTELCDFIIQHPEIDTLYLGKAITDNEDGKQIQKLHYLLSASHNIIPVIQDIELEDDSRYCVVDGMLIDKKYSLVIDYASGRKDKSIHVSDGIIGLKEHCFNYNEYVTSIKLPSTITDLEGLCSLPYLEYISIKEGNDSLYINSDGILYKKNKTGKGKWIFIPPFHNKYNPKIIINKNLRNLHSCLRSQANIGRWENVSYESFFYDEEYNRISINYNGGFYEQEWFVEYEPLPTEIRLGYRFRDIWYEFCTSEIFCKQGNQEDIIKPKCKNCPTWHNCEIVYKSNEAYINKLCLTLREVIEKDSLTIGSDYFYLSIGIDEFQAINDIVIEFFDYALSLREKHPIANASLQPSLFPEITTKENEKSRNFPFDYNIGDSPLGYVNNRSYDAEEPPF